MPCRIQRKVEEFQFCLTWKEHFVLKSRPEIHNYIKSKLTFLLIFHELSKHNQIPNVHQSWNVLCSESNIHNTQLLPDWFRRARDLTCVHCSSNSTQIWNFTNWKKLLHVCLLAKYLEFLTSFLLSHFLNIVRIDAVSISIKYGVSLNNRNHLRCYVNQQHHSSCSVCRGRWTVSLPLILWVTVRWFCDT
jgi:hypothetical protein